MLDSGAGNRRFAPFATSDAPDIRQVRGQATFRLGNFGIDPNAGFRMVGRRRDERLRARSDSHPRAAIGGNVIGRCHPACCWYPSPQALGFLIGFPIWRLDHLLSRPMVVALGGLLCLLGVWGLIASRSGQPPSVTSQLVSDTAGEMRLVLCHANSARRAALRNAALASNIVNALPSHTHVLFDGQ